jgi:hypothetical protein
VRNKAKASREAGLPLTVRPSVQVEVAQRLAVGGVLGLAQGLGKLLLEEVFLVLFRLDRLAEIDSLRSSCSRIACAAVSRSSNIRLRGAGVWLTSRPVAASILSIAPQSGHATSKIFSFVLAIFFLAEL